MLQLQVHVRAALSTSAACVVFMSGEKIVARPVCPLRCVLDVIRFVLLCRIRLFSYGNYIAVRAASE